MKPPEIAEALDLERGLSAKETAKILGLAVVTLALWRAAAKGPRFFVIGGRSVRYRLGDVLAYRDAAMRGAR